MRDVVIHVESRFDFCRVVEGVVFNIFIQIRVIRVVVSKSMFRWVVSDV